MSTGSVAIRCGDVEEDFRSLARWLKDEDALRGQVSLTDHPVADGQMGGVLDAIVVVLTGSTVAPVVTSVFAWLGRRREVDMVVLKVRNTHGAELELKCGSSSDAQQVIESLRTFLANGE